MVHATGGTHDFARAALAIGTAAPLPGPLVASLEVAGGSARGDVPPQHEWLLGGSGSLRGHPGATLAGTQFRRARVELAAGDPAARAVIFGDVGWTNGGRDPDRNAALHAVGVGITLLDDAFRLDFARALDGAGGWRVSLGSGGGS